MSDLKRLEVKYVRDGAKSAYEKDEECYICGSDKELQLHHFSSVTLLWNNWKKANNIVIESAEDIYAVRDDFIEDHHNEIYNETITLCSYHHMERLHKIYGKAPLLFTAKKQKRWCDIRREKEYGLV